MLVCKPSRSMSSPAVVRSFCLHRRQTGHPVSTRQLSRSTCRAQWLESSAQIDVDIPIEVAWDLWEDKEGIPRFMEWISEVKVQKDNKALSRWKLETNQFGRNWTFTWLARNMAPVKYQKIHWRSVEGSTEGAAGIDVANRGEIRFARRPKGCNVRLSISYEVPQLLVPFASALNPLVESILLKDMQRFREFAHAASAKVAS